jgi:4-hydroxy-4-methyl-2-oxoglutarate aldolase
MNSPIDRLEKLDACAVSDAMDSLGLPPAVTGLARLSGAGLLVGRCVTVALAEGKAPAILPKVHLGARAIEAGGPGMVLVISHPHIDAGGWGGVLSNAAQAKGIEGVVLDGPSRDIDEAIGLGFAIFARSTTARTARGRLYEAATNVPVAIGEVTVHPGDFLIADASGVVFVPEAHVENVLMTAERIIAKERLMTEAVCAGASATEVMGADYENMLEIEK